MTHHPAGTGRLVDQVAWVTGAGSGIGRATAIRLAAEGAAVALSTLDPEQAETTRAACRAASTNAGHDPRHHATVTDLTVADQITAAHHELVARLGPVTVLVNNVGVNQPHVDVVDTTDELIDQIMTTNFLSAVRCTRLVLPGMIDRGRGAVVNVASSQGFQGWPGNSAYAASKGALLAWTREVATELGPHGVRINCIVPGATATAMTGLDSEEATAAAEAAGAGAGSHVIPRMGRAEEVAAGIAYLASADASFVTGSALMADGGATIRGH